ncbi:MAG: hypothetical protein ACOCQQ_03335 [Candidatus Nanoarchaeia archaeon]
MRTEYYRSVSIIHHQAYTSVYRSQMNDEVLLCSPQAYDAINVFREAINLANSFDSKHVKNSMYNISYEG